MQRAQNCSDNIISIPSLSSLSSPLPPNNVITPTINTIYSTAIVAITDHTSKIIKLSNDIKDSIKIIIVNSRNVFKQSAVIDLLTLLEMLPKNILINNFI